MDSNWMAAADDLHQTNMFAYGDLVSAEGAEVDGEAISVMLLQGLERDPEPGQHLPSVTGAPCS